MNYGTFFAVFGGISLLISLLLAVDNLMTESKEPKVLEGAVLRWVKILTIAGMTTTPLGLAILAA